jgi:hypothetical protein
MTKRFVELPGGRLVHRSSRWGGHWQNHFERDVRKWVSEGARAKRLATDQAARVDSLRQQADLENVETCCAGELPPVGGGVVTFQDPGVSMRLIYGRDGQILGASAR